MITLVQDLQSFYPAFNDSYIKYQSNVDGVVSGSLTVNSGNLGLDPFVIYPDASGLFVFNLKSIARAGFKNKNFTIESENTSIWGSEFSDQHLILGMTFRTYLANGAESDSLENTFTFKKAVLQTGDPLHSERLLLQSSNTIDYVLNYWEGYPFDVQLASVSAGQKVSVLNRNTGIKTIDIPVTTAGSLLLTIDTGSTNWTSENFLPLTDNNNRLEFYLSNSFYCNLVLKKQSPCRGVYLRWFNNSGGLSYWLFEDFEKISTSAKNDGFIASNNFLSVTNSGGNRTSSGKSASRSLTIKSNVDKDSYNLIETLFLSPNIELWTSREPNGFGQWVKVSTESSISIDSKPESQDISLVLNLPDVHTIKL